MNIYFCDECGTRASDADFKRGFGLKRGAVVVCGSCIEQGRGKVLLAREDDTEDLTELVGAGVGASSAQISASVHGSTATPGTASISSSSHAQTYFDDVSTDDETARIQKEQPAKPASESAGFKSMATGISAMTAAEKPVDLTAADDLTDTGPAIADIDDLLDDGDDLLAGGDSADDIRPSDRLSLPDDEMIDQAPLVDADQFDEGAAPQSGALELNDPEPVSEPEPDPEPELEPAVDQDRLAKGTDNVDDLVVTISDDLKEPSTPKAQPRSRARPKTGAAKKRGSSSATKRSVDPESPRSGTAKRGTSSAKRLATSKKTKKQRDVETKEVPEKDLPRKSSRRSTSQPSSEGQSSESHSKPRSRSVSKNAKRSAQSPSSSSSRRPAAKSRKSASSSSTRRAAASDKSTNRSSVQSATKSSARTSAAAAASQAQAKTDSSNASMTESRTSQTSNRQQAPGTGAHRRGGRGQAGAGSSAASKPTTTRAKAKGARPETGRVAKKSDAHSTKKTKGGRPQTDRVAKKADASSSSKATTTRAKAVGGSKRNQSASASSSKKRSTGKPSTRTAAAKGSSTRRSVKKGPSPAMVYGGSAVTIGILLVLIFIFVGGRGSGEAAGPSKHDPMGDLQTLVSEATRAGGAAFNSENVAEIEAALAKISKAINAVDPAQAEALKQGLNQDEIDRILYRMDLQQMNALGKTLREKKFEVEMRDK